MLPALAQRLDRQFAARRTRTYAAWCDRYLNHPLAGTEILAWRDWLEHHRITQPFKQAHREVYLLTDAERNTGTCSNRFAGHILRQHQFHSLTAIRGWHNKLRIMADATFPPATRELPQWGLRAEFWIKGYGDDAYTDIMASGSYLRLATDQVRFYPAGVPQNAAHDASHDGTRRRREYDVTRSSAG